MLSRQNWGCDFSLGLCSLCLLLLEFLDSILTNSTWGKKKKFWNSPVELRAGTKGGGAGYCPSVLLPTHKSGVQRRGTMVQGA